MPSLPHQPPPVNANRPPRLPGDPEDLVWLEDGPAELPGYSEWQADCRRAEDFAALLAWARASLPAPVMPCTCSDGHCVRCEAARVADDWTADDQPAGLIDLAGPAPF